MTARLSLPQHLTRFLTAVVLLAIIATSCAVEASSIGLDINEKARTTTDSAAGSGEVASQPIETNDLGEQLLQRVIQGHFASSECDFVDISALDQQPDCGWLIRPLHGGTSVTEIELPVMIFESTGATPAEEPLIYLHGGPTDGVISFFNAPFAYDIIVAPFIDERDVIVFDQRGTGLAEPDLRCDSPFQWFSARDENPDTFVSRTARTCAFDLSQDGIRLDLFSRQASADDVMVLARELGHDRFDIHGSSWGGILGYTVMQLHPDNVRSAVLDSPLSTQTDLTGSMPSSFFEAMNAVQQNCELSAACSARHGDIVDRYVRVFAQLEDAPMQLLLGDLFPVTLTADELSYMTFALLYNPDTIARIPDMLLDIENSNTEIIEEMAWQLGWGWGIDFTFLTYMCTDLVSASTAEQVDAQQIGIPAFDRVDDAPDGRGHTAQGICERMRVRQPAEPALREVTPTTPMIVFSGSMDPITPYSSGQQIIDSVPNGTFVGFQDLAHGVTSDPCGAQIAIAFLDNPDAELDLTCSQPENRPVFEFAQIARTVAAN